MFEDMNAALNAETTQIVKFWMNWMMAVFFVSILFVWKHRPARWVLAAILATMVGAMIIWAMTKNVHLFGIVHLILWGPLAVYLWRRVLSGTARAEAGMNKFYFVWISLLFATILISLVFDVRDIYLVMTGAK